jgi:anaerobic selenocysteine-containing dehydrogenase
MSIQLEQDERGYLEQLVRRPMKPTRRQKANALLRLAEGDTPEKAAQHAGIPKEEVESLAARYAESGLAGIGLGG